MEQTNISSFGDDNTVKLSAQSLALKLFAFLSLWVSKLIQRVQGKVGLHAQSGQEDLPCRLSEDPKGAPQLLWASVFCAGLDRLCDNFSCYKCS